MKIINSLEQGTPEWLEIRSRYLTGTDAYRLWKGTQVNDLLQGKNNSSFSGNYYTERGHKLEPINRYIWEQVNGLEVRTPGFICSDEFGIAGYSPDGLVYEKGKPVGLIECKSFMESRHLKCGQYAEPSIYHQMQWGMFVTGLPWCDLCLYNPDLSDESRQWLCRRYKAEEKILEQYAKICLDYEQCEKQKLL